MCFIRLLDEKSGTPLRVMGSPDNSLYLLWFPLTVSSVVEDQSPDDQQWLSLSAQKYVRPGQISRS